MMCPGSYVCVQPMLLSDGVSALDDRIFNVHILTLAQEVNYSFYYLT